MRFIADFHIHSKYSRATSHEMTVEKIAEAARTKGVKLVGSADFTHPKWLEELEQTVKPTREGLFAYDDTYFILVTEVNTTYTQNGKLRRIHHMIFAPDFDSVHRINEKLAAYGNLMADGRPTLLIDSKKLVELMLQVGEDVWVIPSHVWTPWFSLFGSNSGFDSIEECFGDHTDRVIALEKTVWTASFHIPRSWIRSETRIERDFSSPSSSSLRKGSTTTMAIESATCGWLHGRRCPITTYAQSAAKD